MTQIFKPLLTGIAVMLSIASCSEKGTTVNALGADEQGRADAKALCAANYTADRDLHAALLAVKAREWELRRNGDSIAASIYIDAFREQLTESDKTLASKVF